MKEEWLPVVGYEGGYSVSSFGRVRNERTGNILKGCIHPQGYKMHWFPGGKFLLAHRVVAMAFVPGYAPGLDVNHKDFNKVNNCVENLEWVTRTQNMLHAYKGGRMPVNNPRGEKARNAKLTDDAVRAIKARLSKNEVCWRIAKEYGVCKSTIQKIKAGIHWGHVWPGQEEAA